MSAKNIKPGKVKAVAKTATAKTAVVKTAARQTLAAVDEAGLLTDLRGLIAAARRHGSQCDPHDAVLACRAAAPERES